MAKFGSIGECAVPIAEHDFVIVVILARNHEIGNSIPIEVRGRYMEQGSSSRQLKRPGEPERAIPGAAKNCRGIRSEIRNDKVKMTIVGKVASRDRRYRSEGGNVARANQIARAVAQKLKERTVAVPRNQVEVAVSVEVANNERAWILTDWIMRSHIYECAVVPAELDGKKILSEVFAVRQCRLHNVGNSIPIKVSRRNNNRRFLGTPSAGVSRRSGDGGDEDGGW